MSRHRSPGGRGWSATTPAPRTGRTPRHRATAVRHGMGAAAAGGALAAIVPVLITAAPTGADASTALRFTAGDGPSTEGTTVSHLTPVRADAEPDPGPGPVDVAALVKAAGLDEAARADCGVRLPQLGKVKPWAATAARFVACLYDDHDVLGIGGRGRVSDHPLGLAVDFMTSGAEGDRIARCVLANRDALGVSYVIWKQRINYGEGWEAMEDRGSVTENHFDHVHVSFEKHAPDGDPDTGRCS